MDAAKTADAFLRGVKSKATPEGRSLLAQHAWAGAFPTMSEDPNHPYPVFRAVSVLHDRLFDTDVDGVQGYRRLVELKAISQVPTKLDLLLRKKAPPMGTVTIERYLLTSYRDRAVNVWRVLEFRVPSHSAEEVAYCRLDLRSNNLPELMYKYRQYGYWLLLDGKLTVAKGAFQKSLGLNKEPNEALSVSLKEYLGLLKRII